MTARYTPGLDADRVQFEEPVRGIGRVMHVTRDRRGFEVGFLELPGRPDRYFVHASWLPPGRLQVGVHVEFLPHVDQLGRLQARNPVVVPPAPKGVSHD